VSGLRLVPTLALASLALPLCAQQPPAHAWRLTVDNDLIAVRGRGAPPDYDYTHGTRIARDADAWSAELGQQIYTPRRDSVTPVPGERPYAGWLYAALTTRRRAPRRARVVRLEAGVTGHPSLAEPVQNGIHRLLGNTRQLGWAHQLPFEPAFAVRAEEARLREHSLGGARVARATVAYDATVGTLRTAAGVSVTGALGVADGRGATAGVPLAVTGLGLYYLGDESGRAWVSLIHWSVGLGAALVLLIHALLGRRG
jgi:hypothetical protein